MPHSGIIGPSTAPSPTLNAKFQAGRQWLQFMSLGGGQSLNLLDAGAPRWSSYPCPQWQTAFFKMCLSPKPVRTKAKIMSSKQKTSRVFLSLCFFQREDVLIMQPLLSFQYKSPQRVFILPLLWKILQVAKASSFWSRYN